MTKKTEIEIVAKKEITKLQKTISDRLNDLELSQDEVKDINISVVGNTITDIAASFIPGGSQFKTLVDAQTKINEKFEEKKKEKLFENFLNKIEKNEMATEGLVKYISDPKTFVLVQKVHEKLRMEIPEEETIDILSSVLKKILTIDLSKDFDVAKAILNTILRLNILSLKILMDLKTPMVVRSKQTTIGSTDSPDITVDWAYRMALEYAKTNKISGEEIIFTIRSYYSELLNEGCISSKSEINGNDIVFATQYGEKIITYISESS